MASKFLRAERLSRDDIRYFTNRGRVYRPKLRPSGETIYEFFETGECVRRVVMLGSWTPQGVMRDCGDHYIIARYSRYDRVSKNLKEITFDVEDK